MTIFWLISFLLLSPWKSRAASRLNEQPRGIPPPASYLASNSLSLCWAKVMEAWALLHCSTLRPSDASDGTTACPCYHVSVSSINGLENRSITRKRWSVQKAHSAAAHPPPKKALAALFSSCLSQLHQRTLKDFDQALELPESRARIVG